MKFLTALLLISFLQISCSSSQKINRKSASKPNDKTTIILSSKQVHTKKIKTEKKFQAFGILWNSKGKGLRDSVYIRFSQTSKNNYMPLGAFYWLSTANVLSNGLGAGVFGLGEIVLTNIEKLYLNLSDGYIYLGTRKIGLAHQLVSDPTQADFFTLGFSFTVPITINEEDSTITIN